MTFSTVSQNQEVTSHHYILYCQHQALPTFSTDRTHLAVDSNQQAMFLSFNIVLYMATTIGDRPTLLEYINYNNTIGYSEHDSNNNPATNADLRATELQSLLPCELHLVSSTSKTY